MNFDETTAEESGNTLPKKRKNVKRLQIIWAVMTTIGIGIFVYFIYSVGFAEVLQGISKIGFDGFAVILLIYLLRLSVRATSWRLSVNDPHELRFRDTFPAVIIGEALSSMIPLGILISGTAKAVAVRRRVPLVIGLSSVATENLFYSLVTSLFICAGAISFLRAFDLPDTWIYLIDVIIVIVAVCIVFLILMVIRQWHFASATCNFFYRKGILTGILETGRKQVRMFENLVYGFYRRHPARFLPICLLQATFHGLGVLEVWFILSRISSSIPAFSTAFFLESVSRLITIVFKFIPFFSRNRCSPPPS